MSHEDAEENVHGKLDLGLDLDLVWKLENFPLRNFIQLHNSELTLLTINTMSVAGKLKADLDCLIRIMQPAEKNKKNEQLYKFIEDEYEQNRVTCSDLLGVLEITGNQKVLDFIQSKLKTISFVQHQPQQNSTISSLSSNSNPNLNIKNKIQDENGQVPVRKICFNILKPVESFHGRRNFLENLHETIQCERNETEITVLSQVNPEANLAAQFQFHSSLDGIGKTETTRQYIFLYGKYYKSIIWIEAQSRFTMENSFKKLALELGLAIETPVEGKSVEIKHIVQNVYEKLCEISHGQPEKLLIIFDNADYHPKYQNQNQNQPASFSTLNTEIQSESESSLSFKNQGAIAIESFLPTFFLPKAMKKPRILITSRNKNWSSNLGTIQILELNRLTKNEGAEFILNQLGIDANPTNLHGATTLSFLLGGHPLALKLAAHYLNIYNAENSKTAHKKKSPCLTQSIYYFIEKCKTTATSLKLITSERNSLPPQTSSSSSSSLSGFYPIPTGIQITWTIIMEKLEKVPHGILAIQMNEMLTFLYAENIPAELLFSFLPKSEAEAVKQSLRLLENYGLIYIIKIEANSKVDSSESYKSVKIHRLLQLVTFQSLKKSPYGTLKIQELLKTLTNKYQFILQNLDQFGIYNPILLSIHQLLIDDPLELIEETSKFVNLNMTYSGFLRQIGKYEESIELLKIAEKRKKQILVQNLSHPDSFEIQMDIALALFCQEKYDEALFMYENIELAQTGHADFGLDHPQTISTKYHKSVTLRKQGNYSRALEEIEQVVELRRKILGPFLVNTIKAEQEMAYILYMSGDFSLALNHYEILYEKQCRVFGEIDSRSIHSKFFVAMCFLKHGRFREALVLFQELHEILVIGCGLGENHPESLNVEMYMALILEQQGELEECRRILKNVYQQQQILHGENHEETMNARKWLFYLNEKLENQIKNEKLQKI